MELPELPPINSKDSLPYSAIRYVSGYPEIFVQEYAKGYGEQCVLAERERCAKLCIKEARNAKAGDSWRNAATVLLAEIRDGREP